MVWVMAHTFYKKETPLPRYFDIVGVFLCAASRLFSSDDFKVHPGFQVHLDPFAWGRHIPWLIAGAHRGWGGANETLSNQQQFQNEKISSNSGKGPGKYYMNGLWISIQKLGLDL